MRFIFLFILLLPLLLGGQTAPPLPTSGMGGAAPVKQNMLLSAYDSMIAGKYSLAEEQYYSLCLNEPDNLSAHEGYLWALNAQGKFRQSLAHSASVLKQYPGSAQFYNYRAYTLLQTGRYTEARDMYSKALKELGLNPLANEVSHDGLELVYLSLGDYLRHDMHKQAKAALLQKPAGNTKPNFSSSIACALPGDDKLAVIFSQSASYKAWSMRAAYDDLSIAQKQFRSLTSLSVTKQFLPLDVELAGTIMQGNDKRVYPAQQAGIKLSPKLYAGKMLLYPAVMASYSHYPRFDIQQVSFLPKLLLRDVSVELATYYSYMDNLGVGADSSRVAWQLNTVKQLPYRLKLGLHIGGGDYRWMVDGSGVLMDTFDEQGSYYGLSLVLPIIKPLTGFVYANRSENATLLFTSLTLRY